MHALSSVATLEGLAKNNTPNRGIAEDAWSMKSQLIVAVVVLVVVAAHIALYRWVKFKVHEGVILKFLHEAGQSDTSGYVHAEAIAAKTDLSPRRITAVCHKSVEIHADPNAENCWRTDDQG